MLCQSCIPGGNSPRQTTPRQGLNPRRQLSSTGEDVAVKSGEKYGWGLGGGSGGQDAQRSVYTASFKPAFMHVCISSFMITYKDTHTEIDPVLTCNHMQPHKTKNRNIHTCTCKHRHRQSNHHHRDKNNLTNTHTRTHTHTHVHTHTLSLIHTHTNLHTHASSPTHTLTHTNTHTNTNAHTLSLSL